MIGPIIVDAHVLIWFLGDKPKLSARLDAALSDSSAQVLIPAIALAEISQTIKKAKITLTWERLVEDLEKDPRIAVTALDFEIVHKAAALSSDLELHDALIVATALRVGEQNPSAVLATNDAAIRASNLVPIIW